MYLYLILGFVILLFAPIFITVYAYYNKEEKKLYFAIYSLKIIKIISGYVTLRDKGGFYVHANNKAYIINKNTILNFKFSSGDEKAFLPISLYLVVDCGTDFNSLTLISFLSMFSNNVKTYINNTSSFFNYNSDFNLYLNSVGISSINVSFTVCFNIFCIVKALFANHILKGVKNAKKWSR